MIVSGADTVYFPLLIELLDSIDGRMTVGVLDFGLTQDQHSELTNKYKAQVVLAEWDYSVDHLKPKNTFKAMTTRPFLPRYFPGYAFYIWLDADCVVWEWEAIEMLVEAGFKQKFAIVPEVHHLYGSFMGNGVSFVDWAYDTYRRCHYNYDVAHVLSRYPILNCGVFAATPDAPHWALWQSALSEVIKQLDKPLFFAEQAALNYVIRAEGLPTAFLPAYCNFLLNRMADGALANEAGIMHWSSTRKKGKP